MLNVPRHIKHLCCLHRLRKRRVDQRGIGLLLHNQFFVDGVLRLRRRMRMRRQVLVAKQVLKLALGDCTLHHDRFHRFVRVVRKSVHTDTQR